jgi:hypothetical protein
MSRDLRYSFPWLSIFARLKPGVSAPEARTEMNVLWGQLDTQLITGPKQTVAVDPINDLKVPIEDGCLSEWSSELQVSSC